MKNTRIIPKLNNSKSDAFQKPSARGEVRHSEDEEGQHQGMGSPPQKHDEVQQHHGAAGHSLLWHRRGGPHLEGVLQGHGGGTGLR